MVTAELAVAVPAVVLVLACCLAGLLAAALEAAPAGASVHVERWGGNAVVIVRAHTGGWGGFVPAWTLSSTATTPVEEARRWPR